MSSLSMPPEFVCRSQQALQVLCRAHRVQALSLFGSAATGAFRTEASDLDFVVQFEPMGPAEYAEHYFALLRDLEVLFLRSVDLVEGSEVRNPYLLERIRSQAVEVYRA
jgi:uncharacterized protein